MRTQDKRKNLVGLLEAFSRTKKSMKDARLIIKADNNTAIADSESDNRIVTLPMALSHAEINALYLISDAYVSMHHAEGWGLTLSDAMLFAKPVIATGYSGNMEYMNHTNAMLIDYVEAHIRSDDVFHLFTEQMTWAYPDPEHTKRLLEVVYTEPSSATVRSRIDHASLTIGAFSKQKIAELIYARLSDIEY